MPRGYVKVFQYGSNMNPARMNCRDRLNKKARIAGVARLDGWGIRFDLYSTTNECGVTDIVDPANEYVLGVLYDVPVRLVVAPAGELSRMDRFEGATLDGTGNYKRIRVTVHQKSQNITAVTYVGTEGGRRRFTGKRPDEQRVSEDYFGHLENGAEKFKFPSEYRTYLRRQAGQLNPSHSNAPAAHQL
jgi:hypothetical protein